jgi:hypothetical protein
LATKETGNLLAWQPSNLSRCNVAEELYELAVVGNLNGEANECVLHFIGDNLTANDTFASAVNLLNSFSANIVSKWLPPLPASYQIDLLLARRVVPKFGQGAYIQFQKGSQVGTGGSNCCGYQLCPTIFLVPPMGTKSGGKVFFPSIPSARVADNAPSALWISQINTLFNAMATNFGTGAITWVQGILSRKLGTYSHVMNHTISARLGFQSRRRKPVGA